VLHAGQFDGAARPCATILLEIWLKDGSEDWLDDC
jgi:hypothetical protein